MDIAELSPLQQVEAIEQWIKDQPIQLEIETNHYFAGGIYEREIIVPSGALITGKIHLTEHLAKLVKGTMSIYSDGGTKTITGPVTFVSQAGVKRLGYAHDECVFSTFHNVGEVTDVEAITKMLVIDSSKELLEN